MSSPDEHSGGLTAAEVAAFEATDDLIERAKILAGAQRRVLAKTRAETVERAWQRLVTGFEEAGEKRTAWERIVAGLRQRTKESQEDDRPVPYLKKASIATAVSGLALIDPWQRDMHLAGFDSWLLPELQRRQLSLRELEEVAARLPHDLPAVLAPQANALCPQLWRWLRDAQRRRLIRPASEIPELTSDTRWDLTEAGERLGASWSRPLTGEVVRAVAGSVGPLTAVGGLVVSLLTSIGIFAANTRETLLDLAAFALFIAALGFATFLIDDALIWWRKRRKGPRDPVYQDWGEPRARALEVLIFEEAVLQQALALNPDLPRIGMEPPSDWTRPRLQGHASQDSGADAGASERLIRKSEDSP
jgi:hypothetical protein